MDGIYLRKARELLAQRKEANAAERARRLTEANTAIPELREIDAALRGLMGQVLRATLNGDSASELAIIEHESQRLCARKAELLAARGYRADWLDEIYDCPRCRDSGYLHNGEMCECLKKLCEQTQAAELSEALRLGNESFADFDLNWYTGVDRTRMELTLETAKEYAVRFGAVNASLLFQGGTGLGKTFLSGCIAKTVSARGFGVVYEGAQNAFAAFEEQKFSRDAETYAAASERVKRIMGCQLLILDDLGTELTTSFTQSALYYIVNSRLAAHTQTVISTNLSDAELAERYLPQIASRISGEYDTLLFLGEDIRAIRKQQRYS